jgi:protein SMG6
VHYILKHNQSSPQIVEADPEEFSRRLNISSNKCTVHTSRQPHSLAKSAKLFNPNTNPIPMRHTAEPESISDAMSSLYAPRGSPAKATAHQRQLFDHRKDDPVCVSVLARPSSTNGVRYPYTKVIQ